jgi:hypothetical protein
MNRGTRKAAWWCEPSAILLVAGDETGQWHGCYELGIAQAVTLCTLYP